MEMMRVLFIRADRAFTWTWGDPIWYLARRNKPSMLHNMRVVFPDFTQCLLRDVIDPVPDPGLGNKIAWLLGMEVMCSGKPDIIEWLEPTDLETVKKDVLEALSKSKIRFDHLNEDVVNARIRKARTYGYLVKAFDRRLDDCC